MDEIHRIISQVKWPELLVPAFLIILYFVYRSRLKHRSTDLRLDREHAVNTWAEHKRTDVSLDLDSGTVNGIPWQAHLPQLKALGQPKDGDFSQAHLNYAESGLYVALSEDKVEGWDFSLTPHEKETSPCRLTLLLPAGKTLALSEHIKPDTVISHLGKPFEEGEGELSYRLHGWDLVFDFNEDNFLSSVYLFLPEGNFVP